MLLPVGEIKMNIMTFKILKQIASTPLNDNPGSILEDCSYTGNWRMCVIYFSLSDALLCHMLRSDYAILRLTN